MVDMSRLVAFDPIETDLELPLYSIDDPFSERISDKENAGDEPVLVATDLSDDFPDGSILAQTLSGGNNVVLLVAEPPPSLIAMIGLLFVGGLVALRRIADSRGRSQGRKTQGQRKKVRVHVRMMS